MPGVEKVRVATPPVKSIFAGLTQTSIQIVPICTPLGTIQVMVLPALTLISYGDQL